MSDIAKRLDAALVSLGLASGREKAKELIAAELVTVNGKIVTKASFSVKEEDTILCTDTIHRYVGRGGEKLEKIIQNTEWTPSGCVCMDIGASTGGFTDCLLQHGASYVYALDVGHGQLHPSLCANPQVINMEGTDIRHTDLIRERLGSDKPSVAVIDVSFISLESIWESVETLLTDNATVICLIKPQFEAGKSAIGKKGVVKDRSAHISVLRRLVDFWLNDGWQVDYLDYSPITGGEGNIEYLAKLNKAPVTTVQADIRKLVEDAFTTLR